MSRITSYNTNTTSTTVPCRTNQYTISETEKEREFKKLAGFDGKLTIEDIQGDASLLRSTIGQAVSQNRGNPITSWQQLEEIKNAGIKDGTIVQQIRTRDEQAEVFLAIAGSDRKLTVDDLDNPEDTPLVVKLINFAGGSINGVEDYFEKKKLFVQAGRKEIEANKKKKNEPFCVAPPPPPAPTYEFPPRED
ncbi:MAG: hypothetical protein NTW61_02045 [Candidatus Melainabacteria bacterium]|nr:hypothetical protein [Candidatus Melainabacteria bacterium]